MTINIPPGLADECTTLLAFLDVQRDIMVMKTEGLTEAQARIKPAPEANSLLNLIVHVTGVERRWFKRVILGRELDVDREAEFGEFPDLTLADAVAAYRAEWEANNEIGRQLHPDKPCKGEPGFSVRWVLLHLLEETARHAGHADITRELIDGSVGYNRFDRG